MAFDQSTRNRLQKFVSNARAILGEEFTRQLQATYGLDPKQGTVAAIDSLTHLDNRQRQTAHLLRETLAHYLATTPGKGEKDRTKQVLDRIVREQAFTVLNRLAALRMAEARGFLLESISKAHSSKGFQLYRQLSGTAHGETGDAYRNYLFSLFDEFSLDLAVLFDRHSAQGRLFPRETALLEMLAEINHHEIEHLWAEDETIGWIYQYFNSQEERKKMRAESQAPRNSRELAVRNQFFTPRYVVEFLTDNTLGRIWYEMTQGNTALVDSCRYLVRRPTEIFLNPGETAPEVEASDNEALSQEELLKQPVYIPHRPLKDPRSIRMLDPACGSMHFGLYAFDLFERIYLEAWQLEQQLGPDAFEREDGQQALQSTFESLEAFKQQIPKLIIEHNIHGVDIDPRAVQIAGLSLWQRAQRAWHQQGIKPQQRPTIVKSNIVCAEPMPGEKALLQEFTSKLNPPVLGQLLEVIFDKMQLAGEAGTLLKIEEEIQTAIHEAREQWLKQSGSNSVGDLFQAELDAATPQAKLGFDLSGVDDETFWDDAEQRILQALSDYADQAESNADQKRLFAEDAAKGFAFIDLCRKRFDVVLMNPPFGQPSKKVQAQIQKIGLKGRDLAADFVTQGLNLTHRIGRLGAITTRTLFFLKGYTDWRQNISEKARGVENLVDLGFGVLDAAVETAAYTLSKGGKDDLGFYFDQKGNHKDIEDDIVSLLDLEKLQVKSQTAFGNIPRSPMCYWASEEQLNSFAAFNSISQDHNVLSGGNPRDDFRFVRHWIEVSQDESNNYVLYSKGGEFSPYYFDVHLALKWLNGGAELKAHCADYRASLGWSPDWQALMMNYDNYFLPGITWPRRTSRLSFRFLPEGCVFGDKSPVIQSKNNQPSELIPLLGQLNSSSVDNLVSLMVGSSELAQSFEVGIISSLPNRQNDSDKIAHYSLEQWKRVRQLDTSNEVSHSFLGPIKISAAHSYIVSYETQNLTAIQESEKILQIQEDIDNLFRLEVRDTNKLKTDDYTPLSRQEFAESIISFAVGCLFGRWSATKEIDENLLTEDPFANPGFTCPALQETVDKCVLAIEENSLSALISDWFNKDAAWEANLLSDIQHRSIQDYIDRVGGFFSDHLNKYTKSKRIFPIYWPLQTPSGSYTLWVYYHRLNEQTLYTCVNDFVEPKLAQVEQDLNGLRSKTARSSQEEKELEKLSDLASELRDFRDELLRLAKFWKPNLNDGVQITAAPLWKLFQHKAWQKKLKETWESLEKGDYDWAHLACSIWPERVLRKCHQDRSLAIAHDVEDHFWHEVEVPVKRGKKLTAETKLEWQPKDLSDAELSALVKQLAAEVK